MAAEGHALTAGDYIVHHLTHFSTGKPKGLVDFSVINFDSVVFSALVGVLGCWLLWLAARKATSGVPGRFQAAVEILFELVENEAKGIVHNANSRKLVAPLALDRVRLGLPAQRDGPAAGRPAAAHLGMDLRRQRPRPRARLPARRAHGRPVDHDGPCRSACCC